MERKKSGEQNHQEHDHGKMPVILYFIGLTLAIIALLLQTNNTYLSNVLYSLASITAGYQVILIGGFAGTIRQTKEEGKFTPNSHLLMGAAALGASIIGSFGEGTLLILIFSGSHFLEDYAEGRSRREITKLIEMNPTTARRIQENGETEVVSVEDLKIGDHLQVLNGDQIPIDGKILSGSTSIDESSISGESIPKEKSAGDDVFGSTINGSGSFKMEVTKEAQETVFSKILELVDKNQENQTRARSLIEKFEPKYVSLVLITVPLLILLGPFLFSWAWGESIYRGLNLLVVASPCALAASTVSVTLSASSNLSKVGVLSKGSSYLSQLANIEAIAFDKTGTLTQGKPEVTNYHFSDQEDEELIVDLIIALEKESNHPLAEAMLEKFEANNHLNIEVENQIGQGLKGEYQGKVYRIGKVSSFKEVKDEFSQLNEQWANEGKTVVYLAENEEVIGVLALMDLASEHAKETINYFKESGIHTTLITGDSEMTGQAIGKELGMDQVIANILPEDKSSLIKEQQEKYGLTAMVGDGVNDAPALTAADVGIAMGEGTDVAVEVSDLVLMKNDLSKLIHTANVSSKMEKIIRQNIIFAMATVAFMIVASLLGLTDIALSVIIHEGSTIVVILNGLRLLKN
ncbi:MAG: heavy metal translocating P-type ATPase [Atopostipes sp.]|nr:heavy metal translocating P-type ATPase [Atopostipes sp.]